MKFDFEQNLDYQFAAILNQHGLANVRSLATCKDSLQVRQEGARQAYAWSST